MFVRCCDCTAVNWLDTRIPGSLAHASCDECGRIHENLSEGLACAAGQEHLRNARELAQASAIDLPSANSVLLGLMSMHQALELRQREAQKEANVSGGSGTLIGEEAQKPELALFGRKKSPVEETESGRQPAAASQRAGLSAVEKAIAGCSILLAAAALASFAWLRWSVTTTPAFLVRTAAPSSLETREPAGDPRKTLPAQPAEVALESLIGPQRNADGEAVRIRGTTPEAVLRQFCEEVGCAPVALAAPRPRHVGSRVGILRDYSDLGREHGIMIRRDPETGRWSTGNGVHPVTHFVLNRHRVDEHRTPISTEPQEAAQPR